MIFLLKNPNADWDETRAYVIRAKNENEARKIASEHRTPWIKIRDVWLNPELTTCVEVRTRGKSEVILEDFKDG